MAPERLHSGADVQSTQRSQTVLLHCALVVQLRVSQHSRLSVWPRGAGHSEFHIHSGESAVIAPRPVGGFGRRPVAAVAAAKHHTAAALATGELFTWGCNRDGRLGYPAPDTQATPRRCIGSDTSPSTVPAGSVQGPCAP